MAIENKPTMNDPQINDMRRAIEHRATWMYLLLDEAKKAGDGLGGGWPQGDPALRGLPRETPSSRRPTT